MQKTRAYHAEYKGAQHKQAPTLHQHDSQPFHLREHWHAGGKRAGLCRCVCLKDVEEPSILAIPYFESGCSQLAIPDSGGDAPARRAAGTRRPSPYRSEAAKLYADKCGIPPRVHRARL